MVLFILSLIPLGSNSITEHDKINHSVAFFIFTLLGFLAYKFRYTTLFFIGLIGGISIELFQYFDKYRSAELADLAADTVGISIGIFVIFIIKKLLHSTENIFTVYNINLNKPLKEEKKFE